ncbi:MAG: fasciclin domain-containing protein [Deltaproteobacteria bacterium]|nr:MAG: fasciclin domain-containing protein [Deltaproteobacteria bacterium]
MSSPVRKSLLLALVPSLLAVGACGDDANSSTTAPASIAATVATSSDFTTLAAALEAADLTATLAGPGPFTVFAPTDAAFAKLPAGTVEALLADVPALTDVLTYHVVAGAVDAATVVGLDAATTLNGAEVRISVDADGMVVLNDAVKVVTTDIAASNGVIHVIDAVLLPPEEPETNTIVDVVTGDARFSTLATAVTAAGLADTLAGEGPFTVFAPTDAAFEKLPAGTLDALLADQDALVDVLTYHVVDGRVDAAAVTGLTSAMAKNGVDIMISVEEGAVILDGSVKVVETDIAVDNGVIHVIDAVLVPPPTVAGFVAGNADFSTLNAAIEAAGLGETLAGEGPFTLFAPTNAALAAIPEADLNALLGDSEALADLLTYHVHAGALRAADVVAEPYLTMVNGAIAPLATADGVRIAGSGIAQTDIRARNGVIHVIDAVMTPPPTIAEIVATHPDFTTLLAAVDAAGLVETLAGAGPFTVFAPNDDAFAKVDESALAALLDDQTALTDVLLYHVADGVVPAAVAITLDSATMMNGEAVAIDYSAATQSLSVNASTVIGADIYARNGVIHVVDSVLFPPES